MRPYETLIVLSNELGDKKKALIERFEQVITQQGGALDATHDWGNRRLAYPIKKQAEAHYFLLEYRAEGPVVAELERTLRIADGVLRYITVQQEHTGLPQVRSREPRAREHVPLHELRGPRTAPAEPQVKPAPRGVDAAAEPDEDTKGRAGQERESEGGSDE